MNRIFCQAITISVVVMLLCEAKQSRSVINFCSENEQWNVCGDVEPTCDDPVPVYVDGCKSPSCQCKIGFVRKEKECVKLADCNKPSCTRNCEPGQRCVLQWHLWGWTQHCASRRRRGIRPFPANFKSSSQQDILWGEE